jgi:hypothetical protein
MVVACIPESLEPTWPEAFGYLATEVHGIGLPEAILLGLKSDVLSRFVWTVDYDGGALWIPVSAH